MEEEEELAEREEEPSTGTGTGTATSSSARGWQSKALIHAHFDAEVTARYDIDPRMIGCGGYGQVFVATDRVMTGRRVAIKKASVRSSDMRAGFEQEVLVMKDLDHPNVCKVFESFDEGRTVYLVMEYLDGGTLLERLWDQDLFDEPTSADILQQVASALKYVHGRGVAHRDLKLENIMFCSKDRSNNHVKVIDWGIASFFSLRRMKTMVGTFVYAAPEVMAGSKSYTAACDLWSLGVILHAMLCGHLPTACRDPLSPGGSSSPGSGAEGSPAAAVRPAPVGRGAAPEAARKEKGLLAMQGGVWDTISQEAKDLVRGLLCPDPVERFTVDDVLQHPWVRLSQATPRSPQSKQILSNVHRFSKSSSFFTLCASAVAHHLDHERAEDMRQVFREMDTNGDGVLQLPELVSGFERVFGPGSAELHNVHETFARLDLDDSGAVDYTEFLAAGLGERIGNEVDALWAAFRAFDVHDPDCKLSRDELSEVLASADTRKVHSTESVETLLDEIFEHFDRDGDGALDFDEWRLLLQELEQQKSSPQGQSLTMGEPRLFGGPVVDAAGGAEVFDKAAPNLRKSDSCRSTCAGETTSSSVGGMYRSGGSAGLSAEGLALMQESSASLVEEPCATPAPAEEGGVFSYFAPIGDALASFAEFVGLTGGATDLADGSAAASA